LMTAGAIALSLATTRLDQAIPSYNQVATLGWTFTRGPEGSRAVLSVIAGSMMTIASVTFSITIVALQLASSQFGPRLLRNFMKDRGNQVAIGTFISTFTYCLLVLRTVNDVEGERFVPHVAVTVGLTLALISLGVLIYFIHHAAESIQAENVIMAVSRDLHQTIQKLYPRSLEEKPATPSNADPRKKEGLPDAFENGARPVSAPRSDYLQAIDENVLMELAEKHDVVIAVDQRPGQFFFKGGELARVWPGDRLDDALVDAIRGAFYFGHRRTLTQDVEFAIDQLVEVAVRALSPGVNDPFTAIACVDRLGSALCDLAGREIPSPKRYDETGRLRVAFDASTVPGIVDASFHQIRQAARGDTSVTLRLLETIAAVSRHTRDPVFQEALRRHADAIHRGSQDGLEDPWDRQDADQRHRDVIAILEGRPTSPNPTEARP
ncbi:MAG: DUF2254 domain-containing protein, partial [Isosphaeraceae bacterium]